MIKALSRILKQDRERMNIPRSVQQVIPVKRIWLDGIWLVGNKYSKCWRFTDINYAIASKDDKTSMFLDYSELLNALDSNATTKITVCNKRMNKHAFEESILLPLQGDQYDGYRKEYNDSYITNVGFGKGLLKCGNSIVPFVDNFPKNTRLYQLMSTKPGEIQEILG